MQALAITSPPGTPRTPSNAVANPRRGPIGPRRRYNIMTVSRLEYHDVSPKSFPVGTPLRPYDPELYLRWHLTIPQAALDLLVCISGVAEIGAGGHHHVQVFLWDTREKPSVAAIKRMFSNLKSWQIHVGDKDGNLGLDNPYAGHVYCTKDENWRDKRGNPDTGRRMPGAEPFIFGTVPPPGQIQRGGSEGRARAAPAPYSRPEANAAGRAVIRQAISLLEQPQDNNLSVGQQFIAECRRMSKNTMRELLHSPIIANNLPPSLGLLQVCKSEFDQPDTSWDPSRKRRIYCIWGFAGAGKTTGIKKWCEDNGISLCLAMRVDGLYGRWFQKYDGQRAVLFDDFSGNMVDFWTWLSLCHNEEETVNVKNKDTTWRPEYVFFSSNIHPQDWRWYFGEVRNRMNMYDTAAHHDPFWRRFDNGGIYYWCKNGGDGKGRDVQGDEKYGGPLPIYPPIDDPAQLPVFGPMNDPDPFRHAYTLERFDPLDPAWIPMPDPPPPTPSPLSPTAPPATRRIVVVQPPIERPPSPRTSAANMATAASPAPSLPARRPDTPDIGFEDLALSTPPAVPMHAEEFDFLGEPSNHSTSSSESVLLPASSPPPWSPNLLPSPPAYNTLDNELWQSRLDWAQSNTPEPEPTPEPMVTDDQLRLSDAAAEQRYQTALQATNGFLNTEADLSSIDSASSDEE